ncbi:MAG TPA: nitronate monooxygenase [Candidatus Binataceae bacterium]|nr:nitronate monooxygenase [Candidatus Binataceae bacterium]
MFKTRICDLFGIESPIFCAAMGGVAGGELAAAVSEVGGFGALSSAGFGVSGVRHEIAEAQRLTRKPFAVGLLMPLLPEGVFEAVIEAKVPAIIFFWGDAAPFVPRCRAAGVKVIVQVGSVAEAVQARQAGADAIIAQGFEAGGHVRGSVTSFVLIPAVRDAIGDLPLIAAGGIADGRGLAAALALGADGAMFGTRFIATQESAAHPIYKRRVMEGREDQTVYTTLFDIGWPGAPHRVLSNRTIEDWERAGRPEPGQRPGEGEMIGRSRRGDLEMPLVRYGVHNPSGFIEGDVEGMALYAGQSVGLVNDLLTAAEVVHRIEAETRATIANRLAPLTR